MLAHSNSSYDGKRSKNSPDSSGQDIQPLLGRGRVLSPSRESEGAEDGEEETEETENSISTSDLDDLTREERSEGETEGVGEEMKSCCC